MMSRDRDRVSGPCGISFDIVSRWRDVAAKWSGIAANLWMSLRRAAISSPRGRIRGDVRRLCRKACSSCGVSLEAAATSRDILAASPDLRRHELMSSRDEPASAQICGLADKVPRLSENIRGSPPRWVRSLRRRAGTVADLQTFGRCLGTS